MVTRKQIIDRADNGSGAHVELTMETLEAHVVMQLSPN